MYAVIKTGGKQYRVQPGDVLVVEKLAGEVGAAVKFDQVLAHGEGAELTLGAPVVDGAVVHATLIETRRGEKIKIFKKIRRQGYRRTRGHRQTETVLRVTGLEIGGKTVTWDGAVNLDSKALLDAKARGLKNEVAALEALAPAPMIEEAAPKTKVSAKKVVASETVEVDAPVVETAVAEAPDAEAPGVADAEAKPVTAKAAQAKSEVETGEPAEPAAPKKKAVPKAKPASDDAE
jgi:large subunit ribosomal protein L21